MSARHAPVSTRPYRSPHITADGGAPAMGGAVADLHVQLERRLGRAVAPSRAMATPFDEKMVSAMSRLAGPLALFAAVAMLVRLI